MRNVNEHKCRLRLNEQMRDEQQEKLGYIQSMNRKLI